MGMTTEKDYVLMEESSTILWILNSSAVHSLLSFHCLPINWAGS